MSAYTPSCHERPVSQRTFRCLGRMKSAVRTKPVHDIAQGLAASLSSSFEIAIFCAPCWSLTFVGHRKKAASVVPIMNEQQFQSDGRNSARSDSALNTTVR